MDDFFIVKLIFFSLFIIIVIFLLKRPKIFKYILLSLLSVGVIFSFLLTANQVINYFSSKSSISSIITDCYPVIEKCNESKNKFLHFNKSDDCIVWDIEKNDIHNAHFSSLYCSVKDKYQNGLIVFIVTGKRKIKIGEYSISKQPAFRQEADICVVRWPQIEPLGFFVVEGESPPLSRLVEKHPSTGSLSDSIAKWINERYW